MKKLFLFIWALSLPALAASQSGVVLLGQKENIPFDAGKAIYIERTVKELLQSCMVATEIDSIPPVSYKGVRITDVNGNRVEAHIFPDSKDSLMVKVYTRGNGVTRLHGKYSDHAYQLIGMLELEKKQSCQVMKC
jgi:hypothetical protein